MVRVLVTVEPRMYREAIALALQRRRPEAEVMLVPEEVMDGQVKEFAPHVLVRTDFDRAVSEELLSSVVCRMEVLLHGRHGRAGQRRRQHLHDRGRDHGRSHSAGGRGRGPGLGLATCERRL